MPIIQHPACTEPAPDAFRALRQAHRVKPMRRAGDNSVTTSIWQGLTVSPLRLPPRGDEGITVKRHRCDNSSPVLNYAALSMRLLGATSRAL